MSEANYPGSILEVEYLTDRRVAVLTLNAPPFNIVTVPTREHFVSVFREIEAQTDIRAVIIQSRGENFSSGGDIPGFLEASPEYLSHLAENVAAPDRCSKPVIARLTGYTFGVGFEIAMACDFRIASNTTLMALPEMRLGMIPGSGGTQRVARIAGLGRAKDMIFRARRIAAEEAQSWGLVTQVVERGALDATVWKLVDELLAFSPLALSKAKMAINAAWETPLQTGLQLEGQMYGFLRTTEDFQTGVQAFKDKQNPKFRGK